MKQQFSLSLSAQLKEISKVKMECQSLEKKLFQRQLELHNLEKELNKLIQEESKKNPHSNAK
ncbi:hypothetical protein [Acinetobacter sp.]|uniref:hypothetical protein n=1 Tax=Acinetobacter sp. TaxID=472 RepID=UPI0031D85545